MKKKYLMDAALNLSPLAKMKLIERLTDTGDVCCQIVASLGHNGLKTSSPQTRRQHVPFFLQQGRQLLKVTVWAPKQLVLSLKALGHSFLQEAPWTNKKKDLASLTLVHFGCCVVT